MAIELSRLRDSVHELPEGDIAGMLVTAMQIAQLGPAWMRACPRWIIRFFTKMIMSAEGKEQARKWRDGLDEGVVTMEGLAPVLRYDFALCEAMIGEAERFRSIGEVREGMFYVSWGGESEVYWRGA
jgi:hypothetical protein